MPPAIATAAWSLVAGGAGRANIAIDPVPGGGVALEARSFAPGDTDWGPPAILGAADAGPFALTVAATPRPPAPIFDRVFDHGVEIAPIDMAALIPPGRRTGPITLSADSAPLIEGLNLSDAGVVSGMAADPRGRGDHLVIAESADGARGVARMAARPDLNPGNYDLVLDRRGAAPLTANATVDGGGRSVLVLGAQLEGARLQFRDCARVTVYRCVSRGSPSDGFKLSRSGAWGTSDATFYECEAIDAGKDGFNSAEGSGITQTGVRILNCKVSRCGRNAPGNGLLHGIYMQSPDYLIEGGRYADCVAGNGISVRSSGTVRHVEVERAYQSGVAYFADHPAGATGRLMVEQNVFRSVGALGGGDAGRSDLNLLAVPVAANRIAEATARNNRGDGVSQVAPVGYENAWLTLDPPAAALPANAGWMPAVPVQLRMVDAVGAGPWSKAKYVVPIEG